MRLQQELETEKLKQKQWHLMMEHLKETREHAEREHTKYLEELKQAAEGVKQNTSKSMLDWFKAQASMINKPGGPVEEIETPEQERARLEKEAQEKEIRDLQAQQLEITQKLERLTGVTQHSKDPNIEGASQELLLQQLKSTLTNKKEEDPNKALIRALVTAQNKTQGEGGTSTLKPTLLNGILGGDGTSNTMAEWLANLNRQEEGESEISKLAVLGDMDQGQKPGKNRSGILDKATTNIQQKQVWPQQNLGEDWADKEVEFKQMKFEHLVARETHTIETYTDPTQILGRLRLLQRLAYMKLRGYDWQLIRKMYAAILTSIETKEYSWESNFDRFETILYRTILGGQ